MTKHHTTTAKGLWSRAAQTLGRLWAGVISLPDDRRQPAGQRNWNDYSRFPPF
jgi:hypothetical protein